jgi:hypothetical protein
MDYTGLHGCDHCSVVRQSKTDWWLVATVTYPTQDDRLVPGILIFQWDDELSKAPGTQHACSYDHACRLALTMRSKLPACIPNYKKENRTHDEKETTPQSSTTSSIGRATSNNSPSGRGG